MRTALVRVASATWAYVQVDAEAFARRNVTPTYAVPEGWFVTAGFTPGEHVVVAGAQTLLSEELKSQIQIVEE